MSNWNFGWKIPSLHDARPQNVAEAYDYLRANLFAVPIAGQQLREEVDFVALSEDTLVEPVEVPACPQDQAVG